MSPCRTPTAPPSSGWLAAAAVAIAATWPQPLAQAADLAIGAGAGSRPALSLQIRGGTTDAVHLTSHLTDERIVLTGDVQRRMTPSFGYRSGWRLDFYTGLGVEGASERQGSGDEAYHLRLPIGAECDVRMASVVVFAEGAATVGPVPATRLGAAAIAGMHALF